MFNNKVEFLTPYYILVNNELECHIYIYKKDIIKDPSTLVGIDHYRLELTTDVDITDQQDVVSSICDKLKTNLLRLDKRAKTSFVWNDKLKLWDIEIAYYKPIGYIK